MGKKGNMFAAAASNVCDAGIIRFFIFVLSTSILITFCTSCHLELYNHPDFQKHSLSFENSEGNLREEIRSIQVHGSCCWELQVLVGRPQSELVKLLLTPEQKLHNVDFV